MTLDNVAVHTRHVTHIYLGCRRGLFCCHRLISCPLAPSNTQTAWADGFQHSMSGCRCKGCAQTEVKSCFTQPLTDMPNRPHHHHGLRSLMFGSCCTRRKASCPCNYLSQSLSERNGGVGGVLHKSGGIKCQMTPTTKRQRQPMADGGDSLIPCLIAGNLLY